MENVRRICMENFRDFKNHINHSGEVKNGLPHGLGKLTYPNKQKYYLGEFKMV